MPPINYELKYPYDKVPPEVRQALDDLIEEHQLEFADNFRFSPVEDAEGMGQYSDIQWNGCCGCFDTEIDVNGVRWAVGCNYGH